MTLPQVTGDLKYLKKKNSKNQQKKFLDLVNVIYSLLKPQKKSINYVNQFSILSTEIREILYLKKPPKNPIKIEI